MRLRSGPRRRRARHPASVQQGQWRGGQDRHPAGDRRLHPDHRCGRPAPAGRCAAAGRPAGHVRSGGRRAIGSDAGDGASAAYGNAMLNWTASYLTERPIPDLTSGFRAARRTLPGRVPAPAPEWLLDADDHDAGVSEGRATACISSRSTRPAARATRTSGSASDGVGFVLILLKVITIFSPLRIFLPISVAAFVVGRRVRGVDDPDAVARHELVGAADSAERRHFSRRPRLRADFVAAPRGPQGMTIGQGAGDRADLQRARESAGARRGADAASERAGAGRRRSIARRNR